MRPMKPDKEISVSTIRIPTVGGSIPALVLAPKTGAENAVGVLWIHGGGYIAGMKEMVHASRAVDLVKKFGAVVVSPGYRLAVQRPYPAAAEDCYSALIYMKNHVRELGIRRDQIMVGGESAGGGLCAAVCLMARDRASVNRNVRAAPHNSARSLRQDFCSTSAVPKMEEYCMYFPFSELRKWSKKTAETRRRNCAVLP